MVFKINKSKGITWQSEPSPSIKVNYRWIIEQLEERIGSIPDEVRYELLNLDCEQHYRKAE